MINFRFLKKKLRLSNELFQLVAFSFLRGREQCNFFFFFKVMYTVEPGNMGLQETSKKSSSRQVSGINV